MGRDWYWGGKSSSNKKEKEDARQNPGCMNGVLHLFDFHQFQFPMAQHPCFKQGSSLPVQDPTKGVNAPRNSLESNKSFETSTPEVLKVKDFDISVEIRKEAAHVKTRTDDQLSCSDSSSSPGPKTPSLVARLMGLDILPESASSASLSSSPSSVRLNKVQVQSANRTKKQRMNCGENGVRFENSGTRSLPDTPRISSARRSDVDARHSLQIFRENVPSSGELEYLGRVKDQKSRKRELRNEEENRSPGSPGHYARQIVKQVKESVSRRVGLLDITNTSTITTSTTSTITTSTTNTRLKSKEVDVVLLKSKKPKRESNLNKHSSSSNSPRFDRKTSRTHESLSLPLQQPTPSSHPSPTLQPIVSKIIKSTSNTPKSRKPKLQHVPQQQKCKKATCERFTQRKETQLKSKTSATTQKCSPSSPSTSSSGNDDQVSKSGSRLSSSPSRITCAGPPPLQARVRHDSFADEIRYVSEILKCTGIHKDTPVSLARWYSPAHPLDPSLFAYLEDFATPVPLKSTRKLIFDLTDELLSSFIKPYLNMKPWVKTFLCRETRGEQVMQHLCYEISRCPSSNCQTLEDIDDLVERDIPMLPISALDEYESIAFEIERDILDTLVHEISAEVVQVRN